MKRYSLYIIIILLAGCNYTEFQNENWSDGSLKKIVKKKENWTYGKTELISTEYEIKFYKEGITDSLYFYKLEGYYDNGQISFIEYYKNGMKNGKSESWYRNGQKAGEMNYINGMRNGRFTTWFPDGKLLEELEYIMDTITDKKKQFNKTKKQKGF